LRAQFDIRVLPRAFNIVGNGHAGFELITRRGEHWNAWRDYERTANERFTFARTDGVVRNRDGHDLERAVKVIRHVVTDFALLIVGVDDARPDHDRLFSDALERI